MVELHVFELIIVIITTIIINIFPHLRFFLFKSSEAELSHIHVHVISLF